MKNIDKRDVLKSNPFSYRQTKDDRIIIYYQGKQIKLLSVKDAKRLLNRIVDQSEFEVQLELARVTGNFKRGNERNTRHR